MNQGLDRHRQLRDAFILPPRMAIPGTGGSGHPGQRPALHLPVDGELMICWREGDAGLAPTPPPSVFLTGVA